MNRQQPRSSASARNRRVAVLCSVLVAGMVGMAYAAVPLYRIFCQVTGYGGTTQVATDTPNAVLDRKITVRFDANVSRDMDWSFKPAQHSIELKVGETALAFYRAVNTSDSDTMGTATFNVTPPAAGQYFAKVECFCFTEQKLAAGQSVDMPVTFFVDPAIDEDPDLAKLTTITLSYTFYPAEPEEDDLSEAETLRDETDQGT
jgi:cytochrome c oxidase assembly protein subunit 11